MTGNEQKKMLEKIFIYPTPFFQVCKSSNVHPDWVWYSLTLLLSAQLIQVKWIKNMTLSCGSLHNCERSSNVCIWGKLHFLCIFSFPYFLPFFSRKFFIFSSQFWTISAWNINFISHFFLNVVVEWRKESVVAETTYMFWLYWEWMNVLSNYTGCV